MTDFESTIAAHRAQHDYSGYLEGCGCGTDFSIGDEYDTDHQPDYAAHVAAAIREALVCETREFWVGLKGILRTERRYVTEWEDAPSEAAS